MKTRLLFSMFLFLCAMAFSQYESDFQTRAILLRDALIAADFGSPGLGVPNVNSIDDEKHYWPKAIAWFEKNGPNDDTANRWFSLCYTRSPFHFIYVGTVRILALYPTAPSVVTYGKDYITNAFNRNDNYNFVTNEGTENHINMSRTSGYLYCQLAKERYPADFPKADSLKSVLKQWIMDYSKAVYNNGTSEWNSSQYGAYNIVGWLNLYDFATDVDVRKAAKAVLDYYAIEMAMNWSWFALAGAECRSAKGADVDGKQSAEYLGWLWYSPATTAPPQGWSPKEFSQAMHAATSSYRPPAAAIALSKKQNLPAGWHEYSRGSYLFEQHSFSKHFLYYDRCFALGSFISELGGYTGASYAVVPWRLVVSRGNSTFPYTISGNGRASSSTSARGLSPYTQITQYKNVLILMTKTPSNYQQIYDAVRDSCAIVINGCGSGCNTFDATKPDKWSAKWHRDFKLRFPNGAFEGIANKTPVNYLSVNTSSTNDSYLSIPGVLTNQHSGNVTVVDLDSVWMGVIYFNSSEAFPVGTARKRLTDSAPVDSMSGFIVEVVKKSEYSDINTYFTALNGRTRYINRSTGIVRYTTAEGVVIESRYQKTGVFSEPIFDWGWGPKTADPAMFANPTVKFLQPDWSSIANAGRIPYLSINSTPVNLASSADWPTLNGPNVHLDNYLLTMGSGADSIAIDYTGSVPVFYPDIFTESQNVKKQGNSSINIFPNPTTGQLNVTGISGNASYDVIGTTGNVITKGMIKNNVINLAGLPSGVYIIKVAGNGSSTTKLITLKK